MTFTFHQNPSLQACLSDRPSSKSKQTMRRCEKQIGPQPTGAEMEKLPRVGKSSRLFEIQKTFSALKGSRCSNCRIGVRGIPKVLICPGAKVEFFWLPILESKYFNFHSDFVVGKNTKISTKYRQSIGKIWANYRQTIKVRMYFYISNFILEFA